MIGVEAATMPSLTQALSCGHVVTVPARPTLADGLATTKLGENAFAILRERIDKAIMVSEELIALAILRLIELEKSVVEGAGAAPLAALLSGQLPELRGKTVAILLCGGNIDPLILGRIIEIGMAADGRLARLVATISDRPGGLANLATIVAQTGASVQQIMHDRVFSGPDVSSVRLVCDVETNDRAHLDRLKRALVAQGIAIDQPASATE